jgi:hypothetical protein
MSHYRFISMLVGLGMLSACSEGDDRERSAQNDNGADVAFNAQSGNDGTTKVAVDIPGLQGQFKLPAFKLGKTDVNIGGVKLYPGTRVTGVDVAGQEGRSEGGMIVKFDSDAAPGAIQSYYLNAFREKGLTAAAQGSGVSGRDEHGKPFHIDLNAQGAGTRGTISFGEQEG